MSFAPFDGVVLDDVRPPVPGAVAMLLHLRVARRLAAQRGLPAPALEPIEARAGACRELLAHGLDAQALRALEAQGLFLGERKDPRSLRHLVDHLEAYLGAVEEAGFLEPDLALWRAVDAHLAGKRSLWIERTSADGPLAAGLADLAPARLKALACLPELGGATFQLATRKGGGPSGLFGSSQPLVDWFLDGLEQHGQAFPAELSLEEPPGWGAAPWGPALEGLFEGPLDLGPAQDRLQQALTEGPVEMLVQAVEQIRRWVEAGIPAAEITVIHPEPARIAPLLKPVLAAEGMALQVRGSLLPLIESATWSPLWLLLQGLQRLDPCAVSAGLRASQRKDLLAWADLLSTADQTGLRAFRSSFAHLQARERASVEAFWEQLEAWRAVKEPAAAWAKRLEALAESIRLARDPDGFYAPLGLLKEAWGEEPWTFQDMLMALKAFLRAARVAGEPRPPEGLRLLAPSALFEGWPGSRATLILDLSEGAWPARPKANPDLDWDRMAALNQALAKATQGGEAFPPALQRFWLPRSEHGSQVPRAFQRDAYAFSLALALTREHVVVLSPAQDEEGRRKAQGPFWAALEGAGKGRPDPQHTASFLRWRWEDHEAGAAQVARAEAAQARAAGEGLHVHAPAFDHVPAAKADWMQGRPHTSPTQLEALARCPFRSLAERSWGLSVFDAESAFRMAVGSLAHRLLQAVLEPFVGEANWPEAFRDHHGLTDPEGPEALIPVLEALWQTHRPAWLSALQEVPEERWPQLDLEMEALRPNLAAALLEDVWTEGPTKAEVAFLYPDLLSLADAQRGIRSWPLQKGWRRRLLALEADLGPLTLELGGGRALTIKGTLDRLERWELPPEGRAFLRVLDYKTTQAHRLKDYARDGAPFGAYLQAPLYALMAEQVHGLPATAALVPLRDEAPKPFLKALEALAAEDRAQARAGAWKERLRGSLELLDRRLEAGDFPPTPGKHCQGCLLSALCARPVDIEVDADESEEGEA